MPQGKNPLSEATPEPPRLAPEPPQGSSAPDGPALRAEAIRGVRNVGLATYAARAISVLSLVVVARVLEPREVGIAALGLLVGSTLTSLSDFGLAPAIVSFGGRVTRATLARAARMRTGFSIGAFLFVLVGADWIATALGAPEAAASVRVMSLAVVIAAAGFAPAASLAAARQFGALARAYMALSLVQAATTIGLALAGFSFWSVVLGFLAGLSAQVTTQWLLWRGRTSPGTLEIPRRSLLELGSLVTLSWLSLMALFTVDRLFVANLFGTTQLGFYALAVTWGTFAADALNQVVGTVTLPTFAALGENRKAMSRAYLASVRLTSFISAPAAAGIIIVSPELLQLILGAGTDKWLPSLACLQILAIFGLLKSLVGSAQNVLLASQNLRRYAYLIPLPVIAFLLTVFPVLSVAHAIEGIALSMLVAYAVNSLFVLRAITRVLDLERFEVLRNAAGPLIAALLMGITLVPIRVGLSVSWVSLLVLTIAGTGAYVGFLVLSGQRAALDEFVRTLRSMMPRFGRSA